MDNDEFVLTEINDLYIIEPYILSKDMEIYINILQVNKLENIKFMKNYKSIEEKRIVKGLYFIKNKKGIFIDVEKGEIYEVAVDLRIGLDTFGKYEGIILSSDDKRQLYIPSGFGQGYLVLSDEAVINYKFIEIYEQEYGERIFWDETDLNIDWPIEKNQKIKIVDNIKRFKSLKVFNSPFIYEERISSNNIYLEPINKNDIECIRKWRNNEINNKVFFNNNYISREEQAKWYEKYEENASDRMFIIYYEDNPVGTIALYDIDYKKGVAKFGRLLIGDIDNRGKDIGFIATKILCNYGFSTLGLNKIKLEVYKENFKAVNLYKKIGFKEIKEKSIDNREILLMEFVKSI